MKFKNYALMTVLGLCIFGCASDQPQKTIEPIPSRASVEHRARAKAHFPKYSIFDTVPALSAPSKPLVKAEVPAVSQALGFGNQLDWPFWRAVAILFSLLALMAAFSHFSEKERKFYFEIAVAATLTALVSIYLVTSLIGVAWTLGVVVVLMLHSIYRFTRAKKIITDTIEQKIEIESLLERKQNRTPGLTRLKDITGENRNSETISKISGSH